MKETPDQFRAALKKIMPGYQWTVHKQFFPDSPLVATGIQSSGSNRTSTVRVTLRDGRYTVQSSGYGAKSPWQGEVSRPTLTQAFRSLQTHYEQSARSYAALAASLQGARAIKA